MRLTMYLMALMLLSGCAVGERGQTSYLSGYMRDTPPVWSTEVDRPAREFALCLSAYLSGPGSVRIDQDGPVTYVTHYPFYRGLEDYEISLRRDPATERLRVEMRHHASQTRHESVRQTVEGEADRAYRAAEACAPPSPSATVTSWQDGQPGADGGAPRPTELSPGSAPN